MRRPRVRSGGLVLALIALACGAPEGPQPIAWDREPCAHCRMVISEPAFAAQVHTADGEVLSFDDPGCALAKLAALEAEPRALWFHHLREERWLPSSLVAFERVERSPMGYGLGAVQAGSPGALALDAARSFVAERDAQRGGAPR